MKYLVTGRAGSGKSAVWQELQRRDIESFDGDKIPGFARWEDPITGQPVKINALDLTDTSTANWSWNAALVRRLLARPGQLFLCGSADNQLDFHPLFDNVFVLKVSSEVQRQRLTDRDHNYGKDPRLQEAIIKEQAEFFKHATKLGAIAIDSERPIHVVVDEILSFTHDS